MNVTFTIVLTVTIIYIITVCIAFTLNKRNKELKQKLNGFQIENESLQQNIAYLVKHTEEINRIKNEAEKISDKINGAKSDEEIVDIISTIINANNSRVQDNEN